MTRRQFLEVAGSGVATLVLLGFGGRAGAKELLRPPGALDEPGFTAACVRCRLCADVCPTRALKICHPSDGLKNTGTPKFDGYCTLCMRCIQVCPTGALVPVRPEQVRIGVAVLDSDRCIGCGLCVDKCPVKAIGSSVANSKPKVKFDGSRCIGCGLCIPPCPVKPVPIKLVVASAANRERKGGDGK